MNQSAPRRYAFGFRKSAVSLGHRDRAPRGRFASDPRPLLLRPRGRPVLDLKSSAPDWSCFWSAVRSALQQAGFRHSTLIVYRQVLRSLRRHLEQSRGGDAPGSRPAGVREEDVCQFLQGVAERGSASWLSVNLSVLRTAFDKLGAAQLTGKVRGPKRPQQMPEVLTAEEAGRMIRSAPSARDRLLLRLLYGCGLKPGEVCSLRWGDLDTASRILTVRFAGATRQRRVELPQSALADLEALRDRKGNDAYVFVGARGEHTALSTRTAQRIVQRAAAAAGIGKPVSCMTLRHSYALTLRRNGTDVRTVQERLGHARVETTLVYDRYLIPAGIVSPADRLNPAVLGLPSLFPVGAIRPVSLSPPSSFFR